MMWLGRGGVTAALVRRFHPKPQQKPHLLPFHSCPGTKNAISCSPVAFRPGLRYPEPAPRHNLPRAASSSGCLRRRETPENNSSHFSPSPIYPGFNLPLAVNLLAFPPGPWPKQTSRGAARADGRSRSLGVTQPPAPRPCTPTRVRTHTRVPPGVRPPRGAQQWAQGWASSVSPEAVWGGVCKQF